MTSRPPRDTRENGKVHLAIAQAGRPGSLRRHPGDGWQLAAPYPLSNRALRVLRSLIVALCPATRAPRSPELHDRVERSARVFISYMHPTVARGLAFGLVFLDYLPLLSLARAKRLHRLPRAEAESLLGRWAKSPLGALRLLVMGVRSLVLSVYFDQGEVHSAMGYAPVPFLSDRVRRRQELVRPLVTVAAE